MGLLALGAALAMTAAAAAAQDEPSPKPSAAAAPPAGIRSWGYQLQGPDPAVLASVPYDAIVIDYSRDGRDATALSAAEVARLKVKPDGTARLVLAYMSIGEAENYRFYWKPDWNDEPELPGQTAAPAWRAKPNGEWGGNYAVRYWDPDWQAIIIGEGGYLERILKAGFDGVWLDKVDSSQEEVAAGRPTAKADMIAFVKSIGDKGRAHSPGFRVFPQNGEALLEDPAYRAMIDGFGKESLLYGEDGPGKPNSPDSVKETVSLLNALAAEGKPVLAVEYLDDPTQINRARAQIAEFGFVPHFGNRSLATMRVGDQANAAPPEGMAWAGAGSATANAGSLPRDEARRASRAQTMAVAIAALLGLLSLMWRVAAKR
jgi:cysteinyl-tRNA synthetase, unknown class